MRYNPSSLAMVGFIRFEQLVNRVIMLKLINTNNAAFFILLLYGALDVFSMHQCEMVVVL